MINTSDDKAPQPPPYSDYVAPTTAAPPLSEAEWKAKLLSEVEWQTKLKKLQQKVRKYNWTKRGDEAAICASMRDLAASHSDPQVQAYWNRRADEFEKAPDSDKKAILGDIGRGLAILIAAPLAICGALLLGTGMLLKASGDMLMGGKASALTKMK
ncbi:hypothetical protein FB451DRAFT_1205571 [Mycena latifolia]|nr:hypothetical protein FB451DRAFT_1205571 [Mycena latifolia]